MKKLIDSIQFFKEGMCTMQAVHKADTLSGARGEFVCLDLIIVKHG